MGLFGLSLITTEELKTLQQAYSIQEKVYQARRWFSGWKDLDILWDFVFNQNYTHWTGIEEARREYAQLRGTDIYGRPTD